MYSTSGGELYLRLIGTECGFTSGIKQIKIYAIRLLCWNHPLYNNHYCTASLPLLYIL